MPGRKLHRLRRSLLRKEGVAESNTIPTLSDSQSTEWRATWFATLLKNMCVRGSLNLHSMPNCIPGAELATSRTPLDRIAPESLVISLKWIIVAILSRPELDIFCSEIAGNRNCFLVEID